MWLFCLCNTHSSSPSTPALFHWYSRQSQSLRIFYAFGGWLRPAALNYFLVSKTSLPSIAVSSLMVKLPATCAAALLFTAIFTLNLLTYTIAVTWPSLIAPQVTLALPSLWLNSKSFSLVLTARARPVTLPTRTTSPPSPRPSTRHHHKDPRLGINLPSCRPTHL